jgi:hypothetical protein
MGRDVGTAVVDAGVAVVACAAGDTVAAVAVASRDVVDASLEIVETLDTPVLSLACPAYSSHLAAAAVAASRNVVVASLATDVVESCLQRSSVRGAVEQGLEV